MATPYNSSSQIDSAQHGQSDSDENLTRFVYFPIENYVIVNENRELQSSRQIFLIHKFCQIRLNGIFGLLSSPKGVVH